MTSEHINQLVASWRAGPTPEAALAACRSLALEVETGGKPMPMFASELADQLADTHAGDAEVSLAVGRMLLAHGRLDLAKRHLLAAARKLKGPLAPQLLGEVLLRQGDAGRAVRALRRALDLGADEADVRNWYDSALAYVPVQASDGDQIVANMVTDGLRQATRDDDEIAVGTTVDDEMSVTSAKLTLDEADELYDEVSHFDDTEAVPASETAPRVTGLNGMTAIMTLEELEALDVAVDSDGDATVPQQAPPPLPPDPTPPPPRDLAATEMLADPTLGDPPTADDPFVQALKADGLSLDDEGGLALDRKRGEETEGERAWRVRTSPDDPPPPSAKTPKKPPSRRKVSHKQGNRGMQVAVALAAIIGLMVVAVRAGQFPALAGVLPPWLSGAPSDAVPPVADVAPTPTPPAPIPSAVAASSAPATTVTAAPVADSSSEPAPADTGTPTTQPKTKAAAQPRVAARPYTPKKKKPKAEPKPQPKGDAPDEPLWLGDPELN